jgi:hypothetical protein
MEIQGSVDVNELTAVTLKLWCSEPDNGFSALKMEVVGSCETLVTV